MGQTASAAASLESLINSLRCGSTRGLSCVDDEADRATGLKSLADTGEPSPHVHSRIREPMKQSVRS